MTIAIGRRGIVGVVLAVGLLVGAGVAPAPRVAAAELPAWTGGVSLYRDGVFTTQRSWLWCTAAGVQIVRNIVERKTDHTTGGQRRYFEWMRERNRYDLPVSAGVDPAGWTAGLRHFVDDRYRLVASDSFDDALRSAVTRLRQTNLPVALTVSRGNHGWILTGFRATADPAATSTFTVTSVRVTGPLYGLQSKNGYDMAPNTKLTTAELKRFFTPWRYAPKRMVWDGRYVSIQPVPTAEPAAETPSATAAPSAVATAAPTPRATPVLEDDEVVVPEAQVLPTASAVAGAPDPVPVVETAPPSDPTAAIVGSVGILLVATVAAVIVFAGVRRRRA